MNREPALPQTLRVSLTPILLVTLFIAIFAGFQGGRYYLANRLQELGILCTILLYVVGAWRSLFCLNRQEWVLWTCTPLLLVAGIMGISALVFVGNYSGSFIFSVFSAREFLLAFLGPGVYLLCRSGLDIRKVERTLWLALFALMLNYLFFYFTLDLKAAFFSSDHTVSNLVTYDAWRGFRLKPPLFAIMIALLGSLALIVQDRGKVATAFGVATLGLALHIWSIVMFRATLATLILAIVLYPIALSHRNRLHLAIVALPLIALLAPPCVSFLAESFLQADGGGVRAKAFLRGIDHIVSHPILGAGEDSAYGLSYQDIVAPYFFPSDLGLVGVTYKYGFVGLALYLFMHGKILRHLWLANLATVSTDNRPDPLLWAMLLFMTAQTMNLALNPGLAYAQGITSGSLALALAALHLKRCAGVYDTPTFAQDTNRPILGAQPVLA